MSTWLITGCSSGLGRSLATEVLRRGHSAVVTARRADAVEALVRLAPGRALARELDVTDSRQIEDVVAAATETFGGIDVLVNNAGYGYRAAVEEGEGDAVARLFDTNFHGPIRTICAVLPGMRDRRSGAILNVSSSGTLTTAAGSGFYVASKAALEALSGSLRKEVAPLGISVSVIVPGAFRTEFAGSSLTQSARPIADYASTAGARRIEHDTAHGHQPGDPRAAAVAIMDVFEQGPMPDELVLGGDAFEDLMTTTARRRASATLWEEVSRGTGFSADS